MTRHLTILLGGLLMLVACTKEPPPRSITEFVENPMMLEAAMVRCAQNRSETRYDAECVNARQAAARVQAREEAASRAALEAESERKRKALRRTQAAAAEARRRAERAREEAEYIAEYGIEPLDTGEASDPVSDGNLPVAVVPEAPDQAGAVDAGVDAPLITDGANAPLAQPEPTEPPPQ